jgi:2-methylcitrate dehydratase PrpD
LKEFKRIGNEDAVHTYARMLQEMTYEDIPPEVIQYDKWIILDTIGAMLGGSRMDGIKTVVDMVKEKGGKPEMVIPLYGGKVPASEAGMAIGPMARAADWSAIHLEAMHTSEHTLPALIAALGLKEKVNGKDFLLAFALGQEILIKIGNAWKPTYAVGHGRSNGHYIFGSTASVAKLLGLNYEQCLNAWGIVRSMTQPHDMAAFHPICHMVKIHHGYVTQDTINACEMALRGITGPHNEVITGQRGFLGMAGWTTYPEELWNGLGTKWDQTQLESKSFPGCKSTTTAVFGIWELMEKYNLKKDDIANIKFYMPEVSMEMLAGPQEEKLNPADEYECQFSLPYMIATAVEDGKIVPSSYWSDARARESVRSFMPKVELIRRDGIKPWACDIELTTTDGRVITMFSDPDHIRGSLYNQFTEEDYIEKFKILAPYSVYKLSDETIDKLINTILHLEDVEDVLEEVIMPLTPDVE